MNTEVMFSSNTDEWATPQDFYEELNKEFNFDLDPCASDENHKCEEYYTKAENGLNMAWGGAKSVCKPAIFQHFGVGCKMLRGRPQRKYACCDADPLQDRHKVFSRLYLKPGRDTFRKRAFEVWKQ